MKLHYLEFEKPLQQLASKVEELESAHRDNPKLNISKEVKQLQNKTDDLLHQIYDELTPWQISQISRHPQRPYTSDYIENIFTNSMRGYDIMNIEVMKEISEINNVNIYRPLLEFHKNNIYLMAHQYDIPYFLDTTPKWSKRGKMRNEIFPLFDQVFSPSWKRKFKEIGTQSNNWNKTIEKYFFIRENQFGSSRDSKKQTNDTFHNTTTISLRRGPLKSNEFDEHTYFDQIM